MTAPYDRIAELYDDDMGRSAPPGDVAFYVSQARAGGGRVLELGAGTGRIALPIALAGGQIVAADRSVPMLRILQRKAGSLPATARARLHLVAMDFRRPGVHGPFATILCPYSVLTYVLDDDDLFALLRWIRSVLSPQGRFVCDLFVQHYDDLLVPDTKVIHDYERLCADGTVLRRSKTIAKDLESQRNTLRRRYHHTTAAGKLLAEFETVETIRYFFQPQIMALLHAAGLRIEQTYGDFDGHAYSSAAKTMVFVAAAES